MTHQILKNNIDQSNAHRSSRDENAIFILNNIHLFPDFMEMVFDVSDKNHFKACWILELVLDEKLELIFPYLDRYCESLNHYTHHSAIRSISKICMFLAQRHIKKLKIDEGILSEKQIQTIAEKCLDWIIDENEKVASKAYAIRTLFELGKILDWVYPELELILTGDYIKHTAAYKAVAREILKKIK
jgi:hypothetical protein